MAEISLRQQDILNEARQSGRVTVTRLVEMFDVTPQTVRRDLNELCDQRLLSRIHGGAVLASGVENVGYEARQVLAKAEKVAIGELVAREIPDGASLFINLGTTTEAVAASLCNHKDLLVISNNLHVINILSRNLDCDLIVSGGMLRRKDGGLVGEAAADFMRQFKVDYAVIGVSALDEEGSLLDFDYNEVRVAKAIIENSRHVYLVADQSKLSRSAPFRIGSLEDVDALFTDANDDPEIISLCQSASVKLHMTT